MSPCAASCSVSGPGELEAISIGTPLVWRASCCCRLLKLSLGGTSPMLPATAAPPRRSLSVGSRRELCFRRAGCPWPPSRFCVFCLPRAAPSLAGVPRAPAPARVGAVVRWESGHRLRWPGLVGTPARAVVRAPVV
eukprot:11297485-Prorocentrum_lima.AAC.1